MTPRIFHRLFLSFSLILLCQSEVPAQAEPPSLGTMKGKIQAITPSGEGLYQLKLESAEEVIATLVVDQETVVRSALLASQVKTGEKLLIPAKNAAFPKKPGVPQPPQVPSPPKLPQPPKPPNVPNAPEGGGGGGEGGGGQDFGPPPSPEEPKGDDSLRPPGLLSKPGEGDNLDELLPKDTLREVLKVEETKEGIKLQLRGETEPEELILKPGDTVYKLLAVDNLKAHMSVAVDIEKRLKEHFAKKVTVL